MNSYIKKLCFVFVVAGMLVGLCTSNIAQAVGGQGTATIDGGASGGNVSVVQSTSHKFTVVLTIGVSGITANAQNPTFTIPAGFTAPNATPVANAGLVNADGKWSVSATAASNGGTCTVNTPDAGLTVASGQVITVDVTTTCANGFTPPDSITLTYQGQSATTMVAAPLNIGTAVDIGAGAVTPIAAPPTITVTAGSATLNVLKHVINNNGGGAAAGAWTLAVTSSNGGSGTGSAAGTEIGTAYTLQAGKAYSVAESGGPAGYSESDSTDCAIANAAANTTYNCTITNDDVSPQLIVTKIVVGGTKLTSDFPLFVSGTPVVSGVTNNFSVGAYTVTETNSANYTASFSGSCPSGVISLALSDLKTCTITNTFSAPIVSSVSGGGSPLSVPIPPLIDVLKVPSPLALPLGPGLVTYTYTLRNIGTVAVSNITMVGDSCSPVTRVSGDANNDNKLDLGEVWVYQCATTLYQTHTNTITATGSANGISAVDIASATVVVGAPIVPPLIHVTKVPNPLALLSNGLITYTNKVTNPGLAPLINVRLTDDKCSPVKYISGDTNGNAKLDTTETWIYTCAANLSETTTNTVTATGDANGLTATDFAIATVVVSVPTLPDTGYPPKENNNNTLIICAAILAVSATFYLIRKKQIV